MVPRRSVLIVDQSEETREVLRTALAPSGTEVLEATRAEQGLDLARRHHPTVIVLDVDLDMPLAADVAAAFDDESQRYHTPLVLLGTARRRDPAFASAEFVAKPYHYAPLIHRIEALLDQSQQSLARSA